MNDLPLAVVDSIGVLGCRHGDRHLHRQGVQLMRGLGLERHLFGTSVIVRLCMMDGIKGWLRDTARGDAKKQASLSPEYPQSYSPWQAPHQCEGSERA